MSAHPQSSGRLQLESYTDGNVSLIHGEAIETLRGMPSQTVDVVMTDPPYSSGGMMRGDRANATCRTKYQQTGSGAVYSEFSGDNRDQRSFVVWSSIWMGEARRVMKPGALIACFTDWRQLPATSDSMQVAGLVWRGIIPWVKTGFRPCKGRWGNQAEYLVWGTNGPRKLDGPCFPGAYKYAAPRDRIHMTQKPLDLMTELCRVAHRPNAMILDPFMGSGTTIEAAMALGNRAIGIESDPDIFKTAVERISQWSSR